ncbi:hypothetical protein VD0002_g4822 [Verticillium dahliae]|nr:hypothetical protein VdG2_00406 [Verticillium dahliae VDG2]KAH6694409.1 kelch repeat protein [Verticillium dahliae]PNH26711.1 hypothetical protein BJF96_g9974 [Verticillium dahliae]PNH52135.1 hypothetical protein VD0003_g5165 [Verticillium dahliae]PNH63553.1 hypothetical protein VD0002_g4822 [Verticillium dahliae]
MVRPMTGSVAVVLALCLGMCSAQNDAGDNELGLAAVPSNADFLRRATTRATQIGDYVYLDGGEVSQLIDGKPPGEDRPSNAMNRTLSIDMSKSWKPSDVTINEIRKTSPNTNRQALFTDKSTGSFYIWGGHMSWGAPVTKKELWRFTADSSGGGGWTTRIPANPDSFSELRRTEGGAFCNTPDSAFHFGGVATRATDVNYSGPAPGFIHINFTTQAWTNYTEGPWSAFRTIYAASAEYVPTFGPNGLIMLLGGETRELGGSSGNRGLLDFRNLTFMDPVTRDFHSQQTTGNAPSGRIFHCSVGVEGKNGTYEIGFVFGGRNQRDNQAYDDAYVLTLPGFHWEKVDYESKSPRSGHACLVVGKRQMLSIGGVNHEPGMPDLWLDRDPWPQGLGVFDITELKWTNEYDADAEDYDSPEVIKSWYADGGLDEVQWTSGVAALFQQGDDGGGGGGGGGDGSGNGTDPGSDNSSSAPVGAIAGGVVGGVAAVAIAGLLFWFLRRRSRQRAAAGVTGGSEAGVSHPSPSKASYMPVSPSVMAASELDQTHRVEMHDSSPKPELAAPQQLAVELDGTGVGEQAPRHR